MNRFRLSTIAVVLAISAAVAFSALHSRAQQPGAEVVPQGRAAAPSQAIPGLASDKQKSSYGIGLSIGSNMRTTQLSPDDLDLQALLRGLNDGLTGAKPVLSEQDLQQAKLDFHKKVTSRVQDLAAKNKADGDAFLAANKNKEGVKTLASGLQYKIIKSGNGPTPGPSDIVKANYKGTLLDGKVFDSSYDRGEAEQFPVNRVIKGWTEALQLMKVGDKWQLFVPASLAYGEPGYPPAIGPNSVLVFDVELLDVTKPSAATSPAGTLPAGTQQ